MVACRVRAVERSRIRTGVSVVAFGGRLKEAREATHGRPEAVTSVAVPVKHPLQRHILSASNKKRHTRAPRVLRSGAPVLAVKTESVEVPIDVHGDAWCSARGTGGDVKSGESE